MSRKSEAAERVIEMEQGELNSDSTTLSKWVTEQLRMLTEAKPMFEDKLEALKLFERT